MRDEPLYLQKNPHGVYYYRRPIGAEDQLFWHGPSGAPKKEWSRSLRTKDRRTAIELLNEAAEAFDEERAAQLERYRQGARPADPELTQREREERAAVEAVEAEKRARREARSPLRVLWRQRMSLTTAELTPEEAAAHDLYKEKEQDAAKLAEAVAYLEERVAQLSGGAPVQRENRSAVAVTTGPTVEALIEAYERDKGPGWSGSSKKAVAPVFRLLRDLFAGRAIASITREEARGVVEVLRELPTQIGKRKELRDLSIREAVAKGKELGLPTIQPKTINDAYLLHIASMFNWAVREQWIASSPFSGLSVHDPVDDAERRDPFTPEQLRELFSTGPWAAPWERGREKPGAYWVPLLCLFHGLRNGEAAGLRVEDIGEEEGVPVLNVRAYEGKSVKNAAARGTLPIHPELLRLGFLDHVEARREAGEALLFPEGTANNRGQVGAKLGERFSSYVKGLGFTGRKLGMHSFRHNFEDALRAAELPERTALALARRTESGSARVYGQGLSARQKAEALARVEYPGLDFSHLRAHDAKSERKRVPCGRGCK